MNSAHLPPPELPGLRMLTPKEQLQRAKAFACLSSDKNLACEKVIWIGMFFDGTNNNKFRDIKDGSYSNVSVLFDAFRSSEDLGYFRYYIPGLGTPFPEIGELNESDDGKSMAVGGDARVHFAMIQIYDSVHRAVFGLPLVTPEEAKRVVTSVDHGLKTMWLLWDTKRISYFNSLERRLMAAIKDKKPSIKLINLSVFGFSRGAAEARAFSNWLLQCCKSDNGGYSFCGIPIRYQFLGIFDTVASVGLADSSPVGNGFSDWADGTMAIPQYIERCVHFAAAHEIRQSFPLSTARNGNAYPANCTEVVYPGAHCDVGGGYGPGDQGKARAGRSHLASQVPLVNMYLDARKSGVPMRTLQEMESAGVAETGRDFQISKELASRFQAYRKWSHVSVITVEGTLLKHMRLYYRWRFEAGANFTALTSYQGSNEQDREDLLASEMDFLGDMKLVARVREQQGPMPSCALAAEEEKRKKLPVPEEVRRFFDEHVHDSHASFRLLGPITADDRKVAIAKIKQKKAAGKKLNPLEVKALVQDAAAPGSFPVMRDSDVGDLLDMVSITTGRAIWAITDTRRESGGHIRSRRVFDKS